jgi:hypothetical protein
MNDCNDDWESCLLNTGIFSGNLGGYYYILGCPKKVFTPSREIVMCWLVESLQKLELYAEVSSNKTKISITFPKD